MIVFKACGRCGGDIDATYADDVRCVQCAHRPDVVYPGPRVAQSGPGATSSPMQVFRTESENRKPERGAATELGGEALVPAEGRCPRCDSAQLVRLDKLRKRDNTCYRCGLCGHIFSPVADLGEVHLKASPRQA